MIWVDAAVSKPPSYRCVLVQIPASDDGHAAAVAVGYWKSKGKGESALWVVPGARSGFAVSHWCDCLGDDFVAPLWRGTQPGGSLNNRANRVRMAKEAGR